VLRRQAWRAGVAQRSQVGRPGSWRWAFNPTGNVLADKFPVRIGHELYSLYVHSYLDYGQNRVVQKIRTILEREQRGVSEINNPCMMRGNRLFESLTA